MIVKIWAINAHHPKNKKGSGGTKGLKNCLDYIMDPEKVLVKQGELENMNFLKKEDLSAPRLEWDQNEHRVLNYMANEEKIEGKYISGYLCHPESALEQFHHAREYTLAKAGITREKETGAVAFHLVQSFPEGLDISDEEVHQCGLELCEKIGAHQAVVCSHVHPQLDEEDGEIHGKCKHNHILLNAYIHPDKLEPGSKKVKYNDCIDSYAQLQVWNDEIAIDHGLPIIRNPDKERVYSWSETDAKNKGLSWRERIRLDIQEARRAANDWEEFVAIMIQDGYKIRDGVHTSYTAPDGTHKARGNKLGREYTREGLELFWSVRAYGYRALEAGGRDNLAPTLSDIVSNAKGVLKAAVPLGLKGHGERQYYNLPLDEVRHKPEVLQTYFNCDELYDICDENDRPVAAATGQEILDYMEELRRGRNREEQERLDEENRQRQAQTEQAADDRYYTYVLFVNSRTRQPYRTPLFDDSGRRRTTLELLFILAMTVIRQEAGLWNTPVPEGKENDPIFGSTNWKVQNMMDSIYIARDEGIDTPGQLDIRLAEAGASLSRAKSGLQKTTRAKEKMETLNGAVSDYRATKDLAERILAMAEGPEKDRMLQQYADALSQYKTAKAVLYRYQVTEDDKIADFEERYARIDEDIRQLQERYDEAKEEYRRLKKLHYNVSLAQNVQYCYGPAYSYDKFLAKEQDRDSDAARNQRASVEDHLKEQQAAPQDRREKENKKDQEQGAL